MLVFEKNDLCYSKEREMGLQAMLAAKPCVKAS